MAPGVIAHDEEIERRLPVDAVVQPPQVMIEPPQLKQCVNRAVPAARSCRSRSRCPCAPPDPSRHAGADASEASHRRVVPNGSPCIVVPPGNAENWHVHSIETALDRQRAPVRVVLLMVEPVVPELRARATGELRTLDDRQVIECADLIHVADVRQRFLDARETEPRDDRRREDHVDVRHDAQRVGRGHTRRDGGQVWRLRDGGVPGIETRIGSANHTDLAVAARQMRCPLHGVVMERTVDLRTDPVAGEFRALRGYIYVKQDVRGRGGSGGVLDMNAMQEQDGYDAVEWAANLTGSNGKVGMVGRSYPGLYARYAAIAQPPHLAAIAPGVATADPLRIVPYIDMVFSPTIIPWLCLTGVKETLSDISNVDEVRAFNHLPVIESAELAGCPRPKFWDDWFDHQQDDAYWRALSIERRLDRVNVPVLGIAGLARRSRGTIRNYAAMASLPEASAPAVS